jgi:large subunit ribosomal protein L4
MANETIVQYKLHSSSTIKEVKFKISQDNSMYVIHRSLIKQLTEKRQGTASSKTRSEVRGGGRKPWKQKGTGKARAGSIRSPLWRGGGVIFGPKPKSYFKKVNLKEKKLALRTLLYNKASQTIIVQDSDLMLEKPSTRLVCNTIQAFNLEIKSKVLIILAEKSKNFYLGSRNLPNVEVIQADSLNIVSLLSADYLIITMNGLSKIEEVYND